MKDKKYYPTAEEVYGPEVEVGNLKYWLNLCFLQIAVHFWYNENPDLTSEHNILDHQTVICMAYR